MIRSVTVTAREKLAYLQLIRSENVGPMTFYSLLKFFGSGEEALKHLPDFAKKGGRKKPVNIYPAAKAEAEIEALTKLGGEFIAFNEDEYSPLLNKISDAPPLISVFGHKELLQKRNLAIVGTRDASLNGRNMARKLGMEIAKKGFAITSGLALGIDAAAHEGALASENIEGGTIAVLGTGIDEAYPATNHKLYDEIKEKGLLVSEFPLGTSAQQMNFPRRNRIISGLALGVIVVEAKIKSGSLITAHLALEQGRDVYAIPGSPLDSRCQGTNHLIKEGAFLLETPDDVFHYTSGNDIFTLRENPLDYQEEYRPEKTDYKNLDDTRQKIINLLGNGTVCVDELIRQNGGDASAVAVTLVELELAGKLERQPGNRVNLVAEWE